MSASYEDCKYSIAHRDEMLEALDNWQLWDQGKKIKVLEDYLTDLHTNKYRVCESPKDLRTDFNIILALKSKLVDDARTFHLAYYKSLVELYRANKCLSEVKTAMLGFLRSQMNEATVLDFHKSLLGLPDEYLTSKATMLEFCSSLSDIDIPEERKSWLVQKSVENDISNAYDVARKSFEENETWEKFYIMKLQDVSGVKYQEEDELTDDDEHPCIDMDSFIKRLELKEAEIAKKLEIVRQVDRSRNPACRGILSISIQHLYVCLGRRKKS